MEEASLYFQRVVELDPSHGKAYDALGLIHYQLQEYEKAGHSLEQALEHGFERVETHFLLGLVHWHADEHCKAVESLQKAVSLDDTHIESYSALLRLHLNDRDYKAARTCFNKLDELGAKEGGMGYYRALANQKTIPEPKIRLVE